jgi:hypothetical protein
MKMKKKNTTFLLIFFIIVLLFLFLNFFSLQLLNIQEYPDGEVIFQDIVTPGEIFSLKYTHSVAGTPVWEFFEINKKGELILVETHFLDHGAGLPYTAFEDELFVNEDDKFKVKNMSRKISLPLYYRIGKIRENHFIYKDNEINLSKELGDSVVTISIVQSNLFDYFFYKYFV